MSDSKAAVSDVRKQPRIALALGNFAPDHLHRMMEVAGYADARGIDDLTISEHVVMSADQGANPSQVHSYDDVLPEPMVTLGALAAATQRVRLITTILISPLRPAALLAKQAATLHGLSQGRFVMGVSVSWDSNEYSALGIPFDLRGQVLDDQLEACRVLWSGAPVSFHAQTVSFTDVACQPRPRWPEEIPIWFGGHFGPRLVRRVARLGQGWVLTPALGESLESLGTRIGRLRLAMTGAGRDPSLLEVAAPPIRRGTTLEETLACVPDMLQAGVSVFRFHTAGCESVEQMFTYIDELSNAFAPYRQMDAGAKHQLGGAPSSR
jgi:probable F420-dependent oxidoreductase